MTRRSATWYADRERKGVLRRAMVASMGLDEPIGARPLIGICNTWSELNPCHMHLRGLAAAVKRGVARAGGLALEFNTISLHEMFFERTSMLYRNLAAVETEEMLRTYPLDGVVLLGGCDKSIPAQLMALASFDIPAAIVPAGPTLGGRHEGRDVGAGTDATKAWNAWESGEMSDAELHALERDLVPSNGTCAVMGTAATMAAITEALGLALPGATAAPAVDARRVRLAEDTGAAAVGLVERAIGAHTYLTSKSLENAVRVLMALGGSTNAVVHLSALARRLGVDLPLERFDEISRDTPLLARVKPIGDHTLMSYFEAGGTQTVMRELSPLLYLDTPTVGGPSLRELVKRAPAADGGVIATREQPVAPEGGLAVLHGTLAPDGAVIKHSAASGALLRHEGPAVVFDDLAELNDHAREGIEGVDAGSVLVLRNQGPLGGPGMPEVGQQVLIPPELQRAGVRDMVRITDGRMSGTMFGTVVLHVAPEAAAGGPIGLVRTGDRIVLDVEERRLDLLVDETELEARRRDWTPPDDHGLSGYQRLYRDRVTQAPDGCDFGNALHPTPQTNGVRP